MKNLPQVNRLLSALIVSSLVIAACAPAPTPAPAAAPASAKTPAQPAPAAPPATPTPFLAPTPTPVVGEKPRYGGTLIAALSSNPPHLDPRQETTFAVLHPASPMYSTLLQFDPTNYPKIIGDLAESWESAKDGVTWTFRLRKGVKFHDGTPLTSADVKQSFEDVIKPPKGFISPRQPTYQIIQKIETPDDNTVVFTTAYPSGSFLLNMASPWNNIIPKKYAQADPTYFRKNAVGTGPFKFDSFVPGATVTVKKNPNYFLPDRPYLDEVKQLIIVDLVTRAAAIRTGRAHIEFRDFPPSVKDDIVKTLGNKVRVQETGWICLWDIAANTEKPPFNDPKVRLALNYAIDEELGAKVLYPITGLREPGTMIRFGSDWSLTKSELQRLPGWEPDAKARKAKAKELLKEAGIPDGFKFTLKNRDVPNPYHDYANFLIDQWRQVGLNVEHRVLETTPHRTDLTSGNFETIVGFNCDAYDDPDRFYGARSPGSPENFSRFKDPQVAELLNKQSRILDFQERLKVVKELEGIYWKNAYYIKGYWGSRRLVSLSNVRNYFAHPNHYSNQKLQDVWLSSD